MDDRLSVGRQGESLAADYLAQKGYSILERNIRTPYGEVDLIALQGAVTVFFEVKTRRSDRFGFPEQAVTRQKQDRIVASAQAYLLDHPELGDDWRVDVVAIIIDPNSGIPSIRHFEHALR